MCDQSAFLLSLEREGKYNRLMKCSICKIDKPESAFVYRKDRKKLQPHCKECKVKIDYKWAKDHPDLRRASKTKCDRKLRATKPSTRLKDSLRSRLNSAVSNYLDKGNVSHVRDLGCTIEELVVYIQSQFYPHPITQEPMTWSNRGSGPNTWQLDHIIPFCSASTKEDLKDRIHFSNLRPLWWDEHLAKSNTER